MQHGKGLYLFFCLNIYIFYVGVEIWKDGAKYEGFYKLGFKCGIGKFIWGDNSMYEGEFMNNDIEGQGIYTWNDGRKY